MRMAAASAWSLWSPCVALHHANHPAMPQPSSKLFLLWGQIVLLRRPSGKFCD